MRILALFMLLLIAFSETLADQVKVGISAPLTGIAAEYGTAVKNGFLLAQEQKPELERFVYTFDDNIYDPSKSLDSYRKLKTINGVKILYVWGEPAFNVISPVAEAEKFPFFCMSTDSAPGIGRKYAIRASGDSYQLAGKLAEFLRVKSAETFDIVMTEDPFFEASQTALQKLADKSVKITNVATLQPTSTDFRTIILKLKNAKAGFIGVFLQAGQVRVFFKQAANLGLQSQFVGTDVFESSQEISQSGKLIDGSVYANFYVPESFNRTYTERFGNDSQISHAYMAYAFALALPLIAPENGNTDAESILSNATKLDWANTDKAFAYKDSITEGKHFEFPVVLREVRNNKVSDLTLPGP